MESAPKVYEDASVEHRTALKALVGDELRAVISLRICGVFAKAVQVEVRDVYGAWQRFILPIAELTIDGPAA